MAQDDLNAWFKLDETQHRKVLKYVTIIKRLVDLKLIYTYRDFDTKLDNSIGS